MTDTDTAARTAVDAMGALVDAAARSLAERASVDGRISVSALDRHFAGRVQYASPAGGYFLWIRLPGVDADRLASDAEQAGVPVVKGSSCYPDGRGKDELRLAFSAVSPSDITEGIVRLAALVR